MPVEAPNDAPQRFRAAAPDARCCGATSIGAHAVPRKQAIPNMHIIIANAISRIEICTKRTKSCYELQIGRLRGSKIGKTKPWRRQISMKRPKYINFGPASHQPKVIAFLKIKRSRILKRKKSPPRSFGIVGITKLRFKASNRRARADWTRSTLPGRGSIFRAPVKKQDMRLEPRQFIARERAAAPFQRSGDVR